MVAAYTRLLAYINSAAVSKNRAEKAINSILDKAGEGASVAGIYSVTLEALAASGGGSTTGTAVGNERLLFKTRMKLGRVLLARGDFKALAGLVAQLEASTTVAAASPQGFGVASASSSTGDDTKGRATQLLEVCALKVQMHSQARDFKALAAAHTQAVAVLHAAVPHPAILGVIHECGGRLLMPDRRWEDARVEYLAAFKAFEEAGSGDRAIACLRYHLLANMLAESRINPFDSQDTKAYEKHPLIAPMTQLTTAYLAGDYASFEPVLRVHGAELGRDPLLSGYLGDLLQGMRAQVLVSLAAPYTRLRVSAIAAHFGIPAPEAEALAVLAIRDGRLGAAARLDQVAQILVLQPQPAAGVPAAGAGAGAGSGAGSGRAAAPAAAAAAARYDGVVKLGDQLSLLLNALALQ